MGCSSSKKFEAKIKKQANKIDELITMNENLQKNLLEMQQKVLKNLIKYNTDTTEDLTNLKNILDERFSKLEKTIEKINSLTIKESEKPHIASFSKNKVKFHTGDLENEENNFTLSLNFDKAHLKNCGINDKNDISQWNKIHCFSTANAFAARPIYLVAGKRTPIGANLGGLSKFSPKELGVFATQAALSSINFTGAEINECVFGSVYQANQGQNSARQVSLSAGVNIGAHCTTVSKLCSSSIKAVGYVSMSIAKGDSKVALAGGYESMSNVPYLIPNLRKGYNFGSTMALDGLVRDGLEDNVVNKAMGTLAEKTATDFKITREQADEYAYRSYERTIESNKQGWFKNQIVPVKVNDKITISEDEEHKKYNKAKIPTLRPAFLKNGINTAANSSKANDAACTLVLMNEEKVKEYNLKPLARIISFADAAVDPVDFTIAPAYSIRKLLGFTGLKTTDIDFWEINEAFAVTVLSNVRMLDIDMEKVNIHGGAIAQGHPVGFSGAKIILGLSEILRMKKGKYGIASVCNAGGGGTSILIENLQF